MSVPTWVAGQILTADDVNDWFVPRSVKKSGNQSVTSSTSLTNDTELVLAVDSSAIYEVTCHFIYDGDSANDIKIGFTGPSGATMDFVSMALTTGTAASNDTTSHTAATIAAPALIGCLGNGTSLVAPMKGILTVSTTSGNLQVQFAQNSSGSTASRMLAGSTLTIRRIG